MWIPFFYTHTHVHAHTFTHIPLDQSGNINHCVMLQYWFEGPVIEIKPKAHGNSKHMAVAQANRPKSSLQIASQQQGGEVGARGLSFLLRNIDEMKIMRRSGTKKDSNVLYSLMLQCKMSEGKCDSFVQDVKAAPDPQCVLFTDYQISDLAWFTTNSREFSILTADTTYNLGEFYVTPIVYKHLMLENTLTNKNPYFLGPILVHQHKNFPAFDYFASTRIAHERRLKNVRAYGTDGDPALIEALSHNFPDALQLRCFIHLKRNVAEKLKQRGICNSKAQEFLADIFGTQCGTHVIVLRKRYILG